MNESKLRILVFGGSGNLGSRLVQMFVEQGHELAVGVRTPSKISSESVKVYKVDLEDSEEIKNAISNFAPDVVINASYITYAPAIVKQAKDAYTVKHFIFTGSVGVFTKLPSDSADQKRIAEKKLKSLNVPFTVIRPTMIYGHWNDGNISKLSRAFKRLPVFPIIGTGEAMIQPVHISDLIQCFGAVLGREEHYGKFYNVGCKKPITNKELFKTVRRKSGAKVRFLHFPIPLISFGLKCLKVLKIKPITEEQLHRFSEDKSLMQNDFSDLMGRNPLSFDQGCTFLSGPEA